MSEIVRIGRKSNFVTINRSEIYFEMFTNDLDRIKQFIAARPTHSLWWSSQNKEKEACIVNYLNGLVNIIIFIRAQMLYRE